MPIFGGMWLRVRSVVAVDLPAISEVNGIPHGTLRYWAHRYQWQPIGVDERGRKLYDREQIIETLESPERRPRDREAAA